MAHHENYILKVTAGPTYDPTTHQDVHVNNPTPVTISTSHLDARIHVRIKDYRGLPSSPPTSPYFTHPHHLHDRYSIAFTLRPKRALSGAHLVFGNDFDHPIRDRLPPLFDKAFGIVKWWIDPGLDGDVYGDKPFLYGPLLSSINVLRIGAKGEGAGAVEGEAEKAGEEVVFEEGAEGDGEVVRRELGVPEEPGARRKFFLQGERREEFVFEEGRVYACDFFNPYLDFNDFSLKLGYGLPTIGIISHWDGQPLRTHTLRYVLKDRETNTELFVVSFQLIPTEQSDTTTGQESGERRETEGDAGEQGKSTYVDEGVD
ncbi:DUF1769-domain-containing protein [Cenococcum geophilum 1.58]|uniref:DUF1769-domain-containing protein n=1 Tax=Cenococcum geophilum 1.58 TaxID=794803 RepID=UPI00358F2E0E|nr:DUF1769-domain-containing protein [Cenococcum geophilum 1.58]